MQAAIQAVHGAAPTFSDTDWQQIVALYDQLFAIMPTPVVALNRSHRNCGDSPVRRRRLRRSRNYQQDLAGYHLLHATRGTMLRRLGRKTEAITAFDKAVQLAPTERERSFLIRQRDTRQNAWSDEVNLTA